MAGACDAGDRPGLEIRAVHDGRVEFILAFSGEYRTATGIEKRIVFEDMDGCFNGVER